MVDQHPDDPALRGWAAAVGAVFTTAEAGTTRDRADRWRVRRQAQADLRQVCTPWLDPRMPQTPLCARMLRYLESPFVFVTWRVQGRNLFDACFDLLASPQV